MTCSIAGVIAAVLAVIAAIVAALVAANYGPPGWLGAAVLLGGAFLLLSVVESAFRSYVACRDASGGASRRCPTTSITNSVTAIRVVLGIAVTGFLTAAAVVWNIFGGGLAQAAGAVTAARVACGIAIALLLSLLAFIYSYRSCRNSEVPGGTGTGSGGLGGGFPEGPRPVPR
jgi:hypothetical protein